METYLMFVGDENGLRDGGGLEVGPKLTDDKDKWSPYVRQQRENRGWTRAELADRVALSVEMISKIERGERGPSYSAKTRFIKIFEGKNNG